MMQDAFETVLGFLMRPDLDGQAFHDGDPGGDTAYGITAATYLAYAKSHDLPRACPDDMKAWSPTSSIVAAIYRAEVWEPLRCSELPPAVALSVADIACGSGWPRAARMLQSAVGAVPPDGVIGPATLAAVGRCDVRQTVERLHTSRLDYYASLGALYARYGRGWHRRAAEARSLSLRLLEAPQTASSAEWEDRWLWSSPQFDRTRGATVRA